MNHVHVISIPEGMNAGEAWAEICAMGRMVEPADPDRCKWAVIECDGGECSAIEESLIPPKVRRAIWNQYWLAAVRRAVRRW